MRKLMKKRRRKKLGAYRISYMPASDETVKDEYFTGRYDELDKFFYDRIICGHCREDVRKHNVCPLDTGCAAEWHIEKIK